MKLSIIVKLAVLLILLILSACNKENPVNSDPGTTPEDTTYNSAYEDSILFNSFDSRNFYTIHISSITGTGIRPVTSSLMCYAPSWSPNKRKFLFIGAPIGGNGELGLYQMNVSNFNYSQIPITDSKLICAAYSPDMKYIAYAIYNDSSNKKIKLYSLKNEEVKDLTNWINSDLIRLSWSPDSKKILMDNGYVVNIESLEIKILFSHNNPILMPSWSPDGSKIAFNSNGNIFIHNLDTGTTELLHPDNDTQGIASWSKDSKQILFDQCPKDLQGRSYLCKINIDGTNFIKITDETRRSSSPCWYK